MLCFRTSILNGIGLPMGPPTIVNRTRGPPALPCSVVMLGPRELPVWDAALRALSSIKAADHVLAVLFVVSLGVLLGELPISMAEKQRAIMKGEPPEMMSARISWNSGMCVIVYAGALNE